MGMYVSELRSIPIGTYQYYAYIVDSSRGASHSEEIAKFFQRFAAESGIDAVIVSGPRDLSRELYQFLEKNAGENFGAIEHLFHEFTCLIVSRDSLQTTTKTVHVIPLLEQNPGSSRGEYLDQLLTALLNAMRTGDVAEFCRSLGAQELALSDIRGGMVVATLRHLNQALELKPNVAGIGLNINAIIERILGPAKRSV
jgi:hypothetical protein